MKEKEEEQGFGHCCQSFPHDLLLFSHTKGVDGIPTRCVWKSDDVTLFSFQKTTFLKKFL